MQRNAIQDPIVRQLHGGASAPSNVLARSCLPDGGKGKQKATGIQTHEPASNVRVQRAMSASDIEMEEKRKEKEELEKELERVETEAKIAETKKRIAFLKSFSTTQNIDAGETIVPN